MKVFKLIWRWVGDSLVTFALIATMVFVPDLPPGTLIILTCFVILDSRIQDLRTEIQGLRTERERSQP